MIVDTSNEIGGDGDIPHVGVGGARRMQVTEPDAQHEVLIEAVENHMPEVIVVDEIGTRLEADAARTIAQRGVQLIGTAHGHTLENVIKNPSLVELVVRRCAFDVPPRTVCVASPEQGPARALFGYGFPSILTTDLCCDWYYREAWRR